MNTNERLALRSSDTQGLTRWLTVDAVITGVNAIGYIVLSGWLSDHLGPEPGLLLGIGIFLSAFTLLLVAARVTRSSALAVVVVAVNSVWTVTSVAVALAAAFDLTAPGQIWTLLQGLVVAVLGTLQLLALRSGGSAR